MIERLTDALRSERSLLESLLFKLVQTQLLLAADEARFVSESTREVRSARQQACRADLGRAAIVAGLRKAGDTAPDPTLRELAAQASEPWSGMLRDHHDALCAVVAEIELAAHHNARFAQEGLRRVQEDPGQHPAALRAEDDPTLSLVACHSAYRSVLGTADSLRMPALLAFLI